MELLNSKCLFSSLKWDSSLLHLSVQKQLQDSMLCLSCHFGTAKKPASLLTRVCGQRQVHGCWKWVLVTQWWVTYPRKWQLVSFALLLFLNIPQSSCGLRETYFWRPNFELQARMREHNVYWQSEMSLSFSVSGNHFMPDWLLLWREKPRNLGALEKYKQSL